MAKKWFFIMIGIITLAGFWGYLFWRYESIRLFLWVAPLALGFNGARGVRPRNAFITMFVVCWTLLFHYESLRQFYLTPAFQKQLPKTKYLFPPAGWIMYYHVDGTFGHVEVYGIKDDIVQRIDPHLIFRTRTVGFDNIHRGILGEVSYRYNEKQFCRFLVRQFPYFDSFIVATVYRPSVTKEPFKRVQNIQYQCPARH